MKYRIVLTIIIYAAAMCACVSDGDADRVLSVSIEPQRYLLERIAGPEWTVSTVLSKGADPENFDPSMSTMVRTARSKAYFTIGLGGFEEELTRRIAEASPDVVFTDASAGIERLQGTHQSGLAHHDCDHEGHVHGHNHGDADPHIWTSVANMKKIAANMAATLCRIDTAGARGYMRRLSAVDAQLDSLDAQIAACLAGKEGRAFMVEHPSLSYFANDYGLTQIALGAEGKELSAAAIREGIDHGRAEGATVLFTEPQTGTGRVGQIIKAVASKEVKVNTLAYNWPNEIIRIAEAVAQ